jgi:hypothetical protein
MIHFNNAARSRSVVTEKCFQSCQFRHAPQPPDSLDISPCDFFPFGDPKTKLKGEELEGMGELHDRVQELLAQVTSETM